MSFLSLQTRENCSVEKGTSHQSLPDNGCANSGTVVCSILKQHAGLPHSWCRLVTYDITQDLVTYKGVATCQKVARRGGGGHNF